MTSESRPDPLRWRDKPVISSTEEGGQTTMSFDKRAEPGGRLLLGEFDDADGTGSAEQPTQPMVAVDSSAQENSAQDRSVLVAACIDVFDAIGSNALRQQLLGALAAAGVTAVDVPANTRFDPSHHKAIDLLATDEEALGGLVAETERMGFVDRGRRLRWPEVLVYQFTSGEGQ
jgi:molecular chaperone GrpE